MKTARFVLTAALIFAPVAAAFAARPITAAQHTHEPVIHDHAPQSHDRSPQAHK